MHAGAAPQARPRAEASADAEAAALHKAQAVARAIFMAYDEGPEFGESLKGLEGMKRADEILRENGAVGIVIGGMLREVWGEETTYPSMQAHKDVDVLILDPDKYLPERKWQHGIDWWAMKEDGAIYSPGGLRGAAAKPITFAYTVESDHKEHELAPGLYFPGYEFAENMMLIEAMRYAREEDLSDSVTDKLLREIQGKLAIEGTVIAYKDNDIPEEWDDNHPTVVKWRDLPEEEQEDDEAFHKVYDESASDVRWVSDRCPDQIEYLDSSIFRIVSLLDSAANEKIRDVLDPHWRMLEHS